MYFSESEIDNILVAVEESMQNAANLSKSAKMSKALPGEEDPSMGGDPAAAPAPDMGGDPAAAPAPDMGGDPSMGGDPAAAPAPDMGGDPAAEGDMGGDPAAEGDMGGDPAAEGNPDEALQGEEGDISDEELQQIYASMEPQELERHYMIIRGMLRDAYAKMEKSQPVKKSESSANLEGKVSDLVKENEEMKKSLEAAFKAIGHLARPERKAVTQSIQVLGKTESDVSTGNSESSEDYTTLSKQEIVSRINQKVSDPRLSKSDREAINGFVLYNEGKDKIFEILRRK
jgi:hypothetical protein